MDINPSTQNYEMTVASSGSIDLTVSSGEEVTLTIEGASSFDTAVEGDEAVAMTVATAINVTGSLSSATISQDSTTKVLSIS